MRSDTTIQSSLTSPSTVSTHSLYDKQVMNHFTQIRTMLSSFVGQKQETTGTAYCNHPASEVEGLKDTDFQTFRNEAVKLLSSIPSRAQGRGRQPQQPQQQTLSQDLVQLQHLYHRHFNSHSNQPQGEYILTIPETQMLATQVIQTSQQSQVATKGQKQQSRGHLTSFLVIDNQQAGPSRPLTFTLTLTKQFNPPSVASARGKESQHIRTLRILWESTFSA